jgi:preprotein translocase subunit SecB
MALDEKNTDLNEQDMGSNERHISINAQYIKDLSFENPAAPSSLVGIRNPQIDLSLDLHVSSLPDKCFEVVITIEVKASHENQTLFIADLKYGGVFNLINIPPEQQELLLAVHCPAMIFPFARKIIADVTQDGGFQPLMIDPIDFGALYYKKLSKNQNYC